MKILFMVEYEFDDSSIPGTEIEELISCQDEEERAKLGEEYLGMNEIWDVLINPLGYTVKKVEVV